MPLTKDEVLARIDAGESFDGVEIGEVDFSGHVFEKTVNFSGAKFLGSVNFERAKFFGEDKFIKTQFSNVANFRSAQFSGVVIFGEAQFSGEAVFRSAKFSAGAYFWWVQFSDKASFSFAQFADTVIFEGYKDEKVFAENQRASFVSVQLRKRQRVIFRKTNLNNCSLLHTNISRVDFTDVVWRVKRGFLTTRKVIYDEVTVKEKKNYKLVERVYRQLKKNYEDRGSYGEAGDFHYGEMEMQRLSQKGILKYVSLTSFYKCLSGYGEKHWLAFFWLVFAIFLFFPLLYLKSDVATNYTAALFRSLDISTFQKTEAIETITILGKLSEVFQRIFIPSQLTLFLLAIRRRFKR